MRAQRQKIKLLEEGGASEDELVTARARYRVTSAEYSRFSQAMDIPQQRERVTVDGLGAIGNKKAIDKSQESGIIYSIGGKSDNIYEPYNYEPKVTKDVRKVFNGEYKMAEEKFGKISTVKGVHVLNDRSSDEGTYNDNSGHIELRHAEKKNGLQEMARIAREKYKLGEWSSSNPHHAIRHEIGHAIQAEHKANDPLWNDKLSKISDVFDKIISEEPGYKAPSSYAMNDINEFISECIAASYKKSSGKVVNEIIDIINGGV